MRIVSWNMNQSGRAASRDDAWAFLLRLDPDIAVLQEAILPMGLGGYSVLWTRAWEARPWGSAVLSRVGELALDWEDSSRGAVLLSHAINPSLGELHIACIHARLRQHRVIPALRKTFEEIRSRLGHRFIVAGDLNTGRSAADAWPATGRERARTSLT